MGQNWLCKMVKPEEEEILMEGLLVCDGYGRIERDGGTKISLDSQTVV